MQSGLKVSESENSTNVFFFCQVAKIYRKGREEIQGVENSIQKNTRECQRPKGRKKKVCGHIQHNARDLLPNGAEINPAANKYGTPESVKNPLVLVSYDGVRSNI